MDSLFTLTPDPRGIEAVEEWLSGEPHELYTIARYWFGKFCDCGHDVEVQLHDGCPTACVQGAAIGYVNVFKQHVNVGFYTGASLDDPEALLQGTGKRMRHVKLVPGEAVNDNALSALITSAYQDVKSRQGSGLS
ncbi:MAG: DUF1801 domain-containing protein [Gammaproteobacteria bacterium]